MGRIIGEDPDRVDVEVSNEAVNTFTEWFPDCNGIVDVDDALDAMSGYGIGSGEIFDVVKKLQSEGVITFMPWTKMELVDYVEDMLHQLKLIGFDESDDPVSGADCVDVMGEYIPKLKKSVEREKNPFDPYAHLSQAQKDKIFERCVEDTMDSCICDAIQDVYDGFLLSVVTNLCKLSSTREMLDKISGDTEMCQEILGFDPETGAELEEFVECRRCEVECLPSESHPYQGGFLCENCWGDINE